MNDLEELARKIEKERPNLIRFTRVCLTLISRVAIRAAYCANEENILDTFEQLTSALRRSDQAEFWWDWHELESLRKTLAILDGASRALTTDVALKYRVESSLALLPAKHGPISEKEAHLQLIKRCLILISRIADRGACSCVGLFVIDSLAELDFALTWRAPRFSAEQHRWQGSDDLKRAHDQLDEIDGTSDPLVGKMILKYAFGMTWN